MTEPKTTWEEMTGTSDPDAAERRRAIEAIRPYYENKLARDLYEAEVKRLDPSASDYSKLGTLRKWLHDHWGDNDRRSDPLYEDEGEPLIAYLQAGGSRYVYDSPRAIFERDKSLYKRLTTLDCFEINPERVASEIATGRLEAADVEPFRKQSARSASLHVRPEEKR